MLKRVSCRLHLVLIAILPDPFAKHAFKTLSVVVAALAELQSAKSEKGRRNKVMRFIKLTPISSESSDYADARSED